MDCISRESVINFCKGIIKSHQDNSSRKKIAKAFENFSAWVETLNGYDNSPRVEATNIAEDYDDCDQFICSNCEIELQGWYRVERDEDDGDETHHEYSLKYCPNCGAFIKNIV